MRSDVAQADMNNITVGNYQITRFSKHTDIGLYGFDESANDTTPVARVYRNRPEHFFWRHVYAKHCGRGIFGEIASDQRRFLPPFE